MSLEEARRNCPKGWRINPNVKIVRGVINGINRNNGDCPCNNDSEDKHCPCSNFRLKNYCCCNLYLKLE